MKNLLALLLLSFLITTLSFCQTRPAPYVHPEGKFYTINGAKIWTETLGNGHPLFLIAGGPGGSHVGLHSFDPLADNHKLIYFDGFGRGKSDLAKSPTEYSLQRDVEDLEQLRIAMGLGKIDILGHSYGSVVGQAYAIKYPHNVSHLIIANGFHSFLMWQKNCDNSNHEIKTNYPEVWDILMTVREQGFVSADPIHQGIYGRVPYGFLYSYNPDKFREPSRFSDYPNRMNTELYYQMVGKDGDFVVTSDIGTFDFRRDIGKLNMPILVIAGRYDRVAVPSEMIKYKNFCPKCEYVTFERSGHNPQVEEPEKEFKLINEFLAK